MRYSISTLLKENNVFNCNFKVVDGDSGLGDAEVKEKYKCHLCAETFTFSWGLNR